MEEKISKTRAKFLYMHPFLGELALRLHIKEDANITPTMATDGKHLFYNPEFVKTLEESDNRRNLSGVIAHEISHNLFGHSTPEGFRKRQEHKQPFWDHACEYVANHFVLDLCQDPSFRITLPEGCFYDKKYSDGSWTEETIYQDLLKDAKHGGKSSKGTIIDDHSQWGKDKANNGHTKEGNTTGNLTTDWKIWAAQAAQTAKKQGKLPSGLERLIGDLLDPKIPWRQQLAEVVLHRAKNDYSWRRLNKRHLARRQYSPSLYSETINIGYAMDTSGSMEEGGLTEGATELFSLCSVFPSFTLHTFACDATVHDYQKIITLDEFNLSGILKGGGGTDFRKVFEFIEKKSIEIDCLVYFTDAEGSFPAEEPSYPVIWVVNGNAGVPWGKRIQYD